VQRLACFAVFAARKFAARRLYRAIAISGTTASLLLLLLLLLLTSRPV